MGQLRHLRPAAAVAFAYLAWVGTDLGGPHLTHEMTRVAILVVSAGAVAGCAGAAARSDGRFRRGWLLLAAAALCWFISNGVAGVRELLIHQDLPVPASGDGASLVGVVVQVLGLLSFLDPSLTGAGRMRRLTDGLLIASSILFIGWADFLERAYRSGGAGAGRIVALAYPVSHVVLVALALTVVVRLPTGHRKSWSLLLAGQLAFAVAYSAFAYFAVAANLLPGSPETFGWIAGALLVILAAGSAGHTPAAPPDPEGAVTVNGRLAIFLPFIPVVLAGGVAGARIRNGHLSPFLLVDGAVVLVLLLTRQVFAQLDNLELAHTLEVRIKDRTAELRLRERQFRSLVQHASDVLTLVDASGIIRYQSDSVTRVLGFAPGSLIGLPVADLLHDSERPALLNRLRDAVPHAPAVAVEMHLLRADSSWCLTETSVSNLLGDPAVRGILLTSRDVGERRRLEDELRRQALHDPLTGLGNRTVLYDRLSHAIRRASRTPQDLALLLLDLDGFKSVNDTLGHGAGDSLLIEVGRRLKDSVRPGDTVARMGGDEFAVLLEGATSDVAELVAQRIINRLRAPVEVAGTSIVVNGSVGIAQGSTTAFTAEELMRRADLAMYSAKAKGKNRYQVFQAEMHRDARAKVELEVELRRALSEGELTVHYQPLVDIPSGRIGGAEALVRWVHPERGMISPGVFIPVAEESDLVIRLGRFVLNEACRQAKRCQDLCPTAPPFTVSVNVATRQLTSEWLVDEVRTALETSGLDPWCLMLEITEGALMDHNSQTMATLARLRELGVRLAIDDFGTGYSSLSRLRSFPVDELKIDRAFVKEITSSDDEAPLVAAIVAMGHSLHLTIVAEGVETVEQLACLHQHGVETVQGFLLSRPLPADAFEELLSHPTGMLEPVGAGEALAEGELSDAAQNLMEVVSHAVDTRDDAEHGVVAPILAELRRVTGLDQTYLTAIHWEDMIQEVVAVHALDAGLVPAGLRTAWPDSPCARLLADQGGVVGDLAGDPLADEFGVRTFVTVPVTGPGGRVTATLCGVAREPARADGSTKVLFDLFAALLADHVGRRTLGPPATTLTPS